MQGLQQVSKNKCTVDMAEGDQQQLPFDEFFTDGEDDEGLSEEESWLSGQAGYLLAGLMLGILVNLVGRMGAVQRAGTGLHLPPASSEAAANNRSSFWKDCGGVLDSR